MANCPQAPPTCCVVTGRGVKNGATGAGAVTVVGGPRRSVPVSPPMSNKSISSPRPEGFAGGGGGADLAAAGAGDEPKSSRSRRSIVPPTGAGGGGGCEGSVGFGFGAGVGLAAGGADVPTVMPPPNVGFAGVAFVGPRPLKRAAAIFCFSVNSGGSAGVDFVTGFDGVGAVGVDSGGLSTGVSFGGSGSLEAGPHFRGPVTFKPVLAGSGAEGVSMLGMSGIGDDANGVGLLGAWYASKFKPFDLRSGTGIPFTASFIADLCEKSW